MAVLTEVVEPTKPTVVEEFVWYRGTYNGANVLFVATPRGVVFVNNAGFADSASGADLFSNIQRVKIKEIRYAQA